MQRRRRDPARTAEIIDPDDGARLAPDDRPARRRSWALPALGALVLVAGITIALLPRADPPPAPPGPRLGIFDLDALAPVDSPSAFDTTFPVFGRPWGQTLLFPQRRGIVAVDLDTGESRIWLPRDEGASGWDSVSIIDGEIYATLGWGGVARLGAAGATVVHPEGTPGTLRSIFVGDYLVSASGSAGLQLDSLRHLPSLETVDVADATHVAVVGADVIVERGGILILQRPGEAPRRWEDGELLGAGARAVVWRSCRDTSCEAWAGTVDEPRAITLDADVVARRLAGYGRGRAPIPLLMPTLSPDGRYTDDLVDLTDGREVEFAGNAGWLDSDAVLLTIVDPTITLIDTTSGQVARIALLDGAGARRGGFATIVAADALPEIE